MKTLTLTCLTIALLLLATRSASAVDAFIYQPNIYAVLDARMKLEASPSFITHDTINQLRAKFANICLEKAKMNKGTHRPSAISLIDNMSHHERAKKLVKSAFEQVHQAGRAGAR